MTVGRALKTAELRVLEVARSLAAEPPGDGAQVLEQLLVAQAHKLGDTATTIITPAEWRVLVAAWAVALGRGGVDERMLEQRLVASASEINEAPSPALSPRTRQLLARAMPEPCAVCGHRHLDRSSTCWCCPCGHRLGCVCAGCSP